MTSVPGSTPNVTGLVFFIDTHIIDAPDPEATFLRRLHDEGWLQLHRSDAMDTELATAAPEKLGELMEARSRYPETLGAAVWDHARWGATTFGSDDDGNRFDHTFSILFPNADRSTVRANSVKDVMHVSTAIRYGAYAFVTHEKRLLNKRDAISSEFPGFRICSPRQALDEVVARVANARELAQHEPDKYFLPAWPLDQDWPRAEEAER